MYDLGPDWAPEYEVREAAHWFNGMSYTEFCKLPYYERCSMVAHYRVSHMVEAHVSDAVANTPPQVS